MMTRPRSLMTLARLIVPRRIVNCLCAREEACEFANVGQKGKDSVGDNPQGLQTRTSSSRSARIRSRNRPTPDEHTGVYFLLPLPQRRGDKTTRAKIKRLHGHTGEINLHGAFSVVLLTRVAERKTNTRAPSGFIRIRGNRASK